MTNNFVTSQFLSTLFLFILWLCKQKSYWHYQIQNKQMILLLRMLKFSQIILDIQGASMESEERVQLGRSNQSPWLILLCCQKTSEHFVFTLKRLHNKSRWRWDMLGQQGTRVWIWSFNRERSGKEINKNLHHLLNSYTSFKRNQSENKSLNDTGNPKSFFLTLIVQICVIWIFKVFFTVFGCL